MQNLSDTVLTFGACASIQTSDLQSILSIEGAFTYNLMHAPHLVHSVCVKAAKLSKPLHYIAAHVIVFIPSRPVRRYSQHAADLKSTKKMEKRILSVT